MRQSPCGRRHLDRRRSRTSPLPLSDHVVDHSGARATVSVTVEPSTARVAGLGSLTQHGARLRRSSSPRSTTSVSKLPSSRATASSTVDPAHVGDGARGGPLETTMPIGPGRRASSPPADVARDDPPLRDLPRLLGADAEPRTRSPRERRRRLLLGPLDVGHLGERRAATDTDDEVEGRSLDPLGRRRRLRDDHAARGERTRSTAAAPTTQRRVRRVDMGRVREGDARL